MLFHRILFFPVVHLYAQLPLKLIERAVLRQRRQQTERDRAADERAADEKRHIVHPREPRAPVEQLHHRIGDHRADEARTDDLAQHCRQNASARRPVQDARQRRAEDRPGERQRRDAHEHHADDADERRADQGIPRPHEDRADDINQVRHGTHALDAQDGRNNDPQPDHHRQKHKAQYMISFFHFLHPSEDPGHPPVPQAVKRHSNTQPLPADRCRTVGTP